MISDISDKISVSMILLLSGQLDQETFCAEKVLKSAETLLSTYYTTHL